MDIDFPLILVILVSQALADNNIIQTSKLIAMINMYMSTKHCADTRLFIGIDQPVALADAAVIINPVLGHDEQRNTLDASRRAFDARKYQMDNVLGEFVIAAGDPHLVTAQTITSVGLQTCRATNVRKR